MHNQCQVFVSCNLFNDNLLLAFFSFFALGNQQSKLQTGGVLASLYSQGSKGIKKPVNLHHYTSVYPSVASSSCCNASYLQNFIAYNSYKGPISILFDFGDEKNSPLHGHVTQSLYLEELGRTPKRVLPSLIQIKMDNKTYHSYKNELTEIHVNVTFCKITL